MSDPFVIEFDSTRRVLHARVEGFWSLETFEAFAAAFAAQMGELRARGVVFGVLGDATGFAVQGQDVADGLRAMVDAGNQRDRAPTAILVASVLLKMQADRSMTAPHLAVFNDRTEALAWLDARRDRAS